MAKYFPTAESRTRGLKFHKEPEDSPKLMELPEPPKPEKTIMKPLKMYEEEFQQIQQRAK